jgi:hypothetical protein
MFRRCGAFQRGHITGALHLWDWLCVPPTPTARSNFPLEEAAAVSGPSADYDTHVILRRGRQRHASGRAFLAMEYYLPTVPVSILNGGFGHGKAG